MDLVGRETCPTHRRSQTQNPLGKNPIRIMPINVQCDNCERRLRVGDNLAGKKIKCPQCQTVITIPAADAAGDDPAAPKVAEKTTPAASKAPTKSPTATKTPTPSKPSASKPETPVKNSATKKPAAVAPKEPPPAPKKKAVEAYYVKTEDEDYYGPVPKTDLDDWVKEGRLGEDCQLLLDGTDQWIWASDIYPELANAGSPAEDEGFSQPPEEDADDEADTVAFKLPESIAKKGKTFVPEPEPEPEQEEPAEEEHEEEESPPVVVKKSSTKSTGKKKKTASSSDQDEEVSDRAQMVALLLAIFLGSTGAHRFYLGYVLQGVIMAVTCGGALIWQIIDVVQILRGKLPDVHGRTLQK